jgi:hypothetical protein
MRMTWRATMIPPGDVVLTLVSGGKGCCGGVWDYVEGVAECVARRGSGVRHLNRPGADLVSAGVEP